jgi:N-methylhydantoinase A/oxoprolinase/acetone carboxylase beta subunit
VDAIKKDLQRLYDAGYRSLAIVFAHSYTFPQHEQLVGRLARDIGFTQVSESAALLPMIRLVPRGVSSTADAYLTPVLRAYLDGFFKGFDEKLRKEDGPRVEFMGSDGGLLDLHNFSGLKSILSGPAGGVVGYALTSWDEEFKHPIIGFVTVSVPSFAATLCHRPASTSVEPQRTSPVMRADTRLRMRRRRQVCRSSPRNWTSTQSRPAEDPV